MQLKRLTAPVVCVCAWLPALTALWAADAGTPSPQELRQDVVLLELIRRLELTSAQMERILPELDAVQQAIHTAEADRDKLRRDYAAPLDAAREALIKGDVPGTATETQLDRLVQAARGIDTNTEAAIAADEAQVERALTSQQLTMIETRTQEEARRARIQELEGETTAAGYVVKKLTETRDMLPDEYQASRLRIANDIAQRVEGAGSRRFNAFRQQTLRMMDNVFQWSDQQWAESLPTLKGTVTKYLDIRPEANPAPAADVVPYQQYRELIRSPRTPVLIRELLHAEGTEMPAAPPQ
jgi:hypothetical protein